MGLFGVLACVWLPVQPATVVAQAVPGTTARSPEESNEQSSATAYRLVAPVWRDAAHFARGLGHLAISPGRWESREWLAVPVAAAGLVAMSALDGGARDLVRRSHHEDLDGFLETVERLGTIENFRILAGFYVTGLIFDDMRARHVAVEGVASALVAAGVITPALQFAAGRARPRAGEGPYAFRAFSRNISFPSGHTTHAFAVASVIATEYEALWVKATAYGLASVVAASRMYHDAHHLSDVTAAALIGTAVGRSVAHFGQRERSLRVEPVVTPNGSGLAVRMRF